MDSTKKKKASRFDHKNSHFQSNSKPIFNMSQIPTIISDRARKTDTLSPLTSGLSYQEKTIRCSKIYHL